VTRSAAALALLCIAGCTAAPGDAPGTYVLHQRGIADTLWVRKDGTWAHRYTSGREAPVATRGDWEFEEMMDRPAVTFHRFPYRAYPGYAPLPSRTGVWPAFIEHTVTGAVVLPVNDDLHLRYHRISRHLLGSGGRMPRRVKDGGGAPGSRSAKPSP
jgi:hypothetical protein